MYFYAPCGTFVFYVVIVKWAYKKMSSSKRGNVKNETLYILCYYNRMKNECTDEEHEKRIFGGGGGKELIDQQSNCLYAFNC